MRHAAPVDARPRTLFVHHRSGIGDLVWHVPYIRAAAAGSRAGRVTLLARPSCRPADVLAAEAAVDEVIEYDYRPRGARPWQGQDSGLAAQLGLVRDLRARRFDRMLVFSNRWRYAALGRLAGIPRRAGFGFGWWERRLLNEPPYISRDAGPGAWVYAEATAFAVAQRLVSGPLRPRLAVLPEAQDWAERELGHAPAAARCAFAIGSSEARKQWGAARFAALATHLAARGVEVILLGGPGERRLAAEIVAAVPARLRPRVRACTQALVQRSAALLQRCGLCVGNDTGALNLAVAVETPAIGLFGATPPLTHDPLLHAVTGDGLHSIGVQAVLARIDELPPTLRA